MTLSQLESAIPSTWSSKIRRWIPIFNHFVLGIRYANLSFISHGVKLIKRCVLYSPLIYLKIQVFSFVYFLFSFRIYHHSTTTFKLWVPESLVVIK